MLKRTFENEDTELKLWVDKSNGSLFIQDGIKITEISKIEAIEIFL